MGVTLRETGRNEPDNETLNKLSKLFHVSLGYVAGYEKVRKDIPLSDDEVMDMLSKKSDERMQRQFEREHSDLTEEELENIEYDSIMSDFDKNGKGMFLEAFLFNKACEYMSQSQRNRALNSLKAVFPSAFRSSYNPD